jgi:hypothetical protein
LRKKSPINFYKSLQKSLENGEQIIDRKFAPLPIDRLLNHLRLPLDPANASFSCLIEKSASILIREEGLSEAFRRLSTIPVLLPQLFIEQFKQLTPAQRNEWHKKSMAELYSPLSKIQYLRLILNSKDDSASLGEAEAIIKSLFSEEDVSAFEAFKNILQWTYDRIREQTAKPYPASYLLATSWTHAVRLHNILSHCSTQKSIAGYFEQLFRPNPHDAFAFMPKVDGDLVHPRLLRRTTLLAHGLMAAMTNNEAALKVPGLKEEMRKLCFYVVEGGGVVPKLDLLVNPLAYYNNLDTFLATDRDKMLAPLLGDDAKMCSVGALEEQTDATLSALIDNPQNKNQWILLHTFQGPICFSGSLKEKVRTLLLKTQFSNFIDFENSLLRLVLFLIMNQAKLLNDEEVFGHAKSELVSLARQFAERSSSRAEDKEHADILMEATHYMVGNVNQPADAAKAFCETVSSFLDVWPSAADHLLPLFNRLIFSLPEFAALELWPLVLRLRREAR